MYILYVCIYVYIYIHTFFGCLSPIFKRLKGTPIIIYMYIIYIYMYILYVCIYVYIYIYICIYIYTRFLGAYPLCQAGDIFLMTYPHKNIYV